MSLPPDPRVKGTATYNRDEIIAAVTEYYEFLVTLPWIEPKDILYPPKDGWPNITKVNFAALGRNDEVVELLRNLPYINMENSDGQEYLIAPDAHPVDYRASYYQKNVTLTKGNNRVYSQYPVGIHIPPWVVPLTCGHRRGPYLLLDTTDGTVTDYYIEQIIYPESYKPDDPRHWRDMCDDKTKRLTDRLKEYKTLFSNLEWIAFPSNGWPDVRRASGWNADEVEIEEFKSMQNVLREHGWPDEFRRSECKAALYKWDQERASKK